MTSIFSKSALKTPIFFFKNSLKIQISTIVLSSTNIRARGIMLPDINYIPQTFANKKAWYSLKNRCIEKWNKIESTAINSYIHGQLIFSKDAKNTLRINDILSK